MCNNKMLNRNEKKTIYNITTIKRKNDKTINDTWCFISMIRRENEMASTVTVYCWELHSFIASLSMRKRVLQLEPGSSFTYNDKMIKRNDKKMISQQGNFKTIE